MSRATWRAGVVLFMVFGAGCGGATGQHTGAVAAGPPAPPLDAGTQPTGDVCEGLRPHPPGAPVSVKTDLTLEFSGVPFADGEGNVLTTKEFRGIFTDDVYSPDGGLLGRSFLDGFLNVPLASGFAGAVSNTFAGSRPPDLEWLHPDGGLQTIPLSVSGFEPPFATADPRGGLVLSVDDVLTGYDDNLVPRWSAKLPLDAGQRVDGFEVDVAGNTLVLETLPSGFDVSGLWVDATGHAGAAFPIGHAEPPSFFGLVPDVRGGFFLQYFTCVPEVHCSPVWTARYPPLSTVAEPVPAWLSPRPDAVLHLIKERTAYAVGGDPLPACTFEVRAADGTFCGLADFSAALAGSAQRAALVTANAGSSPPCERVLDVGRDGTVTSFWEPTGCAAGNCPAYWAWFPAYFH